MRNIAKSEQVIAENWHPTLEKDREAVRLQLEKIVRHPLFVHSRRYPAVLRYVVEQALAGTIDHIKERTIGVLVFGRDPSYDANADPIVRVTAGEVRKRLNHYYSEPEHALELRIELVAGSYVPHFLPATTPVLEEEVLGALPPAPPIEPLLDNLPPPVGPTESNPKWRRWMIATAAMAFLVSLAFIILAKWSWRESPTKGDAVRTFWSPIVSTSSPIVTLCIGTAKLPDGDRAGTSTDSESFRDHFYHSPKIVVGEAAALLQVRSLLSYSPKTFRLRTVEETSFETLREGPVILIGGLDNEWTRRLTEPLRFVFQIAGDRTSIVDRRNPQKAWNLPLEAPYTSVTVGYGLIARYFDETIGQPVIVIAGMGDGTTAAATELLSDRNQMDDLVRRAPKDWKHMNMEAVVQTEIVDGHSSPPHLLATEFW